MNRSIRVPSLVSITSRGPTGSATGVSIGGATVAAGLFLRDDDRLAGVAFAVLVGSSDSVCSSDGAFAVDSGAAASGLGFGAGRVLRLPGGRRRTVAGLRRGVGFGVLGGGSLSAS